MRCNQNHKHEEIEAIYISDANNSNCLTCFTYSEQI